MLIFVDNNQSGSYRASTYFKKDNKLHKTSSLGSTLSLADFTLAEEVLYYLQKEREFSDAYCLNANIKAIMNIIENNLKLPEKLYLKLPKGLRINLRGEKYFFPYSYFIEWE